MSARAAGRAAVWALAAVAVALAGCADGRSVVTLTISSDSPIGNVDRLHIVATDDVRHRDANPVDVPVAAHTVPPDVTVPLAAPSTVKGALTFAVTALAADGTTVAAGTTDVTVAPSKSFTATVKLTPMAHRALSFATQPANAKPNQTLGSVQVAIVDDAGTTLTDATDVVSLTLAGGATTAVLSGHIRVAAVAGVATFPDLSVNLAGTGYTIAAGAPMADGATSDSFDITPDVWVPSSSGVDGGTMTSLCFDPNDANRAWVLSALGSGLWHTSDGGASWAQYGATLPADATGSCAVSSKSSDTIFLSGSGTPLRRSDDGGASWDVIGNNLPTGATYVITVDPTDDNIVYATGFLTGIFVSKDRGVSFSAPMTPPPQPGTIVLDAQTPTTMYAVGSSGGAAAIYKSTDGGLNWAQPANAGLPALTGATLAMASTGRIYASVVIMHSMYELYRSDDGAKSWTAVGSLALPLNSLVVDRAQPTTLYAGMIGQVLRSIDGGATFQPMAGVELGRLLATKLAFDAAGNLWALPQVGAPYKSTDKMTFTFAGKGISGVDVWSLDLGAGVATAGTFNRGVFASTNFNETLWQEANNGIDLGNVQPWIVADGFALGERFYHTTNGGTSWTEVPINGVGGTQLTTFAAASATVYAIDDANEIIASTNGGTAWTASTTPLPAPTATSTSPGIRIDPATTSTAYVFGVGFLLKTTNSGSTFTDVQPAPAAKPSYSAMVLDPVATGVLYVSTSDGQLFKSVNGGTAWTTIGSGLPASDSVVAIAVDPLATATVYATTAAKALYKSTDGGATFKKIAAPPGLQSVSVDPSTEGHVLAATTFGIWRTTNGGE